MSKQDKRDGRGAAQFGNFHQYYEFNHENKRLDLIPASLGADILRNFSSEFTFLDIGCNEGNLTLGLAQKLKAGFIETLGLDTTSVTAVGVDIDGELIRRAVIKGQAREAANLHSKFFHMSVMDENSNRILSSLVPLGLYDLVCCFSVTMWIHLNHGDAGLFRFLSIVCNLTNNIIIEPQEWRSYTRCAKRWRRLGEAPPVCIYLTFHSRAPCLAAVLFMHRRNTRL
jgi:SAM-dependent methyltransferase